MNTKTIQPAVVTCFAAVGYCIVGLAYGSDGNGGSSPANLTAPAGQSPQTRPASVPAASAEEIKNLIAQLGDKEFEVRESAFRRLVEIGDPAEPALQETIKIKGQDPEVISRAKNVLKTIPVPNIKELIQDLSSQDGEKRLAATRKILELDERALKSLEDALAESECGKSSSRIEIVYRLLGGLNIFHMKLDENQSMGVSRDRFSLKVEDGCGLDDVKTMGKKYGFSVTSRSDSSWLVKLDEGKNIKDVIKNVLSNEPKVVTIALLIYTNSAD